MVFYIGPIGVNKNLAFSECVHDIPFQFPASPTPALDVIIG